MKQELSEQKTDWRICGVTLLESQTERAMSRKPTHRLVHSKAITQARPRTRLFGETVCRDRLQDQIAQTELDILQRELNLGSVQYYPIPQRYEGEVLRESDQRTRKAIEIRKRRSRTSTNNAPS